MNVLKFIGKSCAMYAIGAFVFTFTFRCLKHPKEKKVEQSVDTNACGFEVDNEEWRNETGEILVRGFTR